MGRNDGGRSKSRPPLDHNNASSSKMDGNLNDNLDSRDMLDLDLDVLNGIGLNGGHENEIPDKDIARVETHQITSEQPVNSRLDKGKKPMECDIPPLGDGPSSTMVSVLTKPTNAEKKTKNKNKKKNKKANTEKQGVDEEMKMFFENIEDGGSCDTEYVNGDMKNKNARFFGNEEKGRHPKSASRS